MKGKSIAGIIVVVVIIAVSAFIIGKKSSTDVQSPASGESVMSKQSGGQGNTPVAYNEVVRGLKDLVARDPNNAELHSRLGDAYFEVKQFNAAAESYKRAVAINPSDVDAFNDLALSYHYMNNTAEGLVYVNQGIEKNPGYQRIWLTKGFLMAFGLGSSQEAVAALQKAYDLDPTTPVGKAAKAYLEELKNK
jgi:tetratricopeptide (TPR) repeat protein